MILSTKLHIPHSRFDKLVERPMIIEMLNDGLKTKLTIVTAPGGYGKTTALSHWVQQNGTPVAWVSLDSQDNDLIQFWSYVIAAVDHRIPNFAEALRPYLSTLKSGTFESFITAMVQELSGHSNELVLILDDFHSIGLSSIHASVAYLLEWLPAGIHLYIASRAELPFPVARWNSAGQVVKVTIQDLRFQLEDGVRYFRDNMGFMLPEADITMLVRRTEGWISGLHLAAISLKNSDNPIEFIRAFNGEDRNISDYLFQEVLSRQSEDMQSFLLKTSILHRMNDALCEAVTGQTNCQELLELLEHYHLFIVPLDQQRKWYRYHHLFSEFLRNYSRKKSYRLEPLHLSAANWLADNGYLEEAVEQCLIGEHYLEAASLLDKHLLSLKVRSGVMRRWFSVLPDSCLAGKPGVQFLYVKMLIETDETELADSRLSLMEGDLSDPQWEPYIGAFLYMSAYISFYRKDIRRTTEYLEKFDLHMPEGSYIQMIEANTYTANYDSLVNFFSDLHEAEQFFRKWIKVWENRSNYPFVGFFYVAYSEILYEWNRLEEAEIYVERVQRQKCMQPYGLIQSSAAIFAARISQAKGDSAKAFDLLEQVKLKLDSPDKSIFIKILDAEKVYFSLVNDRFDYVTAWMKSCGLHAADPVPPNRVREYVHLARALAEYGREVEAMQLLERLYRIVEAEDRLRGKVKVLILQSLVFHRKGEATNALMKLEAALQLAEPSGFIRSFMEEGPRIADLLSQYLDHRQSNRIGNHAQVSLFYVKKLLLLMNVQMDEASISGSLTKQELKIVQMLEKGLSNKQIAEQTQVSVETVKSHLKNIFKKLEVNNRWQALQRGKELKLL
jgi:LuxR family transcriptional regulator, maltose regulon positive regulatory protein